MRWDSLFGDLESQMSAERALRMESEISDRARVDVAGVDLADRLRGALRAEITVTLADGCIVTGRLGHVGSGWVLVAEGARQWLVPMAGVTTYHGLGRLARKPASPLLQPLGMGSAVRALAQDRNEVTVHVAGSGGACRQMTGVIDRVGRDHFDLTAYPHGDSRRPGEMLPAATVPFDAVSAISSRGYQ